MRIYICRDLAVDQEAVALAEALVVEASEAEVLVAVDPEDSGTVLTTDLITIIITDLCFGDLDVLTDLDTDMAVVASAECLAF